MPTVTFPDYGYIQAGTPATVRCRGGMKNRPWADVTAHTRQKEEDVWEHALNMKHTHSYKHTNKVVFLLHSLYPCTNTQLLGDQLLHSVTEGLNRGQQTPSGLQSERQCQEFQEGGVQAGSHSTGFCGLRAAYSDDLLQQPRGVQRPEPTSKHVYRSASQINSYCRFMRTPVCVCRWHVSNNNTKTLCLSKGCTSSNCNIYFGYSLDCIQYIYTKVNTLNTSLANGKVLKDFPGNILWSSPNKQANRSRHGDWIKREHHQSLYLCRQGVCQF